jgi:hypothetical protein
MIALHSGKFLLELLLFSQEVPVVIFALTDLGLLSLPGFEALGELDGAEVQFFLQGFTLRLKGFYQFDVGVHFG